MIALPMIVDRPRTIWSTIWLMARTQTLVPLSDQLLAQLDARAARDGRNRPELFREALADYLAGNRETDIDRRIVEAYTHQPPTSREVAFTKMATRTMLTATDPWARAATQHPVAA